MVQTGPARPKTNHPQKRNALTTTYRRSRTLHVARYERVWNQRFSYIFKHSFDDISSISDFFEFYENANEFVENPLLSPTLPDPSIYFYETNPNKRKFVVRKSSSLSDLYRIKENIKEINSIALSSLDDEF